MKAQELRIGNYVYYKNTKDFAKVELIHNNHFDCRDEYGSFTPNGSYEPIELTEEILLKCGFNKKQDYINGVGLCIFFEHKEFNYRLNQSFEVVLLKIKLNNLHQLQNLYWCLTNEELNVKL